MEQSNKHAPRIDEQLMHDEQSYLKGQPVDARVDEQRRDEGPGPRPGQASADAQPPDRQRGTSEGLSALEIDLRSEFASYLQGVDFPTNREEIIESVYASNAPSEIIQLAQDLPYDEEFYNFREIWQSIS